jgi:hypothetical protein
MGKIQDHYKTLYSNNKEVAMSALSRTGNQTSNVQSKTAKDPRFKSAKFRDSVRIVLDHHSMDMDFKNFRANDGKNGLRFAWIEAAEIIRKKHTKPVFAARCFLTDSDGDLIPRINGHATIAVDLPGKDRETALRNINSAYRFISWM